MPGGTDRHQTDALRFSLCSPVVLGQKWGKCYQADFLKKDQEYHPLYHCKNLQQNLTGAFSDIKNKNDSS